MRGKQPIRNLNLLPINGILLLDKPKGLTSNQALQKVKRLFLAKKAGHTGSLDPIATGLLPICFGEATKFCQFLLEADKHYWVQARLGIRTETGDSEGAIIEHREIPVLTQEKVQEALSHFQGEIAQIPPMFSALKHQGKPLYQLARQGIVLERTARNISIKSIKLLAQTSHTLSLEIKCSKGTYIRTLVDELGKTLGCGAHVIELRRLGLSLYTAQQMVKLEQLENLAHTEQLRLLLPLDTALSEWPELYLSEAAIFYLRRGQALALPGTPAKGWVRLILTAGKKFIGIGQIQVDGRVAPYRLVHA
jgi:tRNA pseudouridine55 synthase